MEKIKNFLFVNSSTKQTIIKNIVWLSGGITLSKIFRSVMIIYAARILGTSGYGIFAYAISLAAVFSALSDIGLSSLLTRELVKRTEKKEYLATSLILKIGLVGLTTLVIAFISPLFTNIEEIKPLMVIMAGLVAFDSIRGFLFSISRAENRMQFESVFEIISEIFITTTGLIILFNAPSVWNFSLGYLLASGLGCMVVIIAMRNYISHTFVYFRKELLAPILKSAWPFVVMGIFGAFMTNIDAVIVGLFQSTNELGLFAAAQKPILILYLIPGFLYTTLFPFMSQYIKNNDEEKLSLLLRKSILVSVGLALPIVVGGIVVASPLINVIYGYEYIGAVLTFQVLLLTLLPIFPGTILSSVLLAEDKQKIFVKSSMVGASINIILNLILIPQFGIVGSAIATIFAQLAVNGIFLLEIRKNHQINIGKDTKKMFFAVLLMGVSVLVMEALVWPLVLIILFAGVIYFGVLLLLKEKLITEMSEGL